MLLHLATCIWKEILYIGSDCFGKVRHSTKATTRGAVIEKVTNSSGWILLQEVFTCSMCFLVLPEQVVGYVYNAVDVDYPPDALHLHVCHQREDQDGLYQQLPVLRLGDVVQHRLHMNCKLDLTYRHLSGG